MENLQLIREQIVVSPNTYTVPAESEEFRNELALRGRAITGIATADENQMAAAVVGEIRRHVKDVSAVRMLLSKPLDEAKARLIEIEREHIAPLVAEQERLQKLGTVWADMERRRLAEEAQKRREEIARLEREKREAEAKAEADRVAAEQRRLAEEAAVALKASKMKNEEKRKAFEAEQERLALERDQAAWRAQQAAQAEAERAEQAVRDRIIAAEPEAQKAKGQSSRKYLKFKVLDAKAVYAARPELCTVEVKASAVSAVVTAKDGATDYAPDITTVPGLELWWEEKTTYKTR